MIIVMSRLAEEADIRGVAARIEAAGLAAHVSRGRERTVIGAVGEERGLEASQFESLPGVERALRVVGDYRIVSREAQPQDSVVRIGACEFGLAGRPVWLAGPRDWTHEALTASAAGIRAAGGGLMFAGPVRQTSNPYHYEPVGMLELEALREESAAAGLAAAAELSDIRLLDVYLELGLDALMIGPASLHHVELLREVGRINKPVILLRDTRMSLEGWLLAAEHVAMGGNHQIVLCECGAESEIPVLDAGGLAWLRQRTHLPVIAAPASGHRATRRLLAASALSAGACGWLLEWDGQTATDLQSWLPAN
ncbi:3-deoxy-7-phosphoheptulonate synthase [Chromobacterium sp. IIBBL 290-4]|uniref:3-deoxy-7-phosphoheptulonate synthase n=1 Tax=Chromobacterium sp. IIBBL 290-4 TaxID=2953890 RepID=UPI0020B8F98C|nr:3-deoxy-7-phosphoheptulonate synthase [Chromobacterium sp. IIBBL 290-4]UTH73934.1 3-deoxy-7-phosphoheptulonate synthase [Chromobacterium sp. IIBBL 290-4]